MSELTKLLLSCLLIMIWVFLNVAGITFVLRRRPTRVAVAGVTGLATFVSGLLGIVMGLVPNRGETLIWAVGTALMLFAVLLLWTYINPALQRTTWEEMIQPGSAASGNKKNDSS